MGNISTLQSGYTGSIAAPRKTGIGLVLQGGGAYAGPYTAGFLYGLQKHGFFDTHDVRGVSATSAGALNARIFFQSPDYKYNAGKLRWLWDAIGYAGMPAEFTTKMLKGFELAFAAATFFSGYKFSPAQAASNIGEALGANLVPDMIKSLVNGLGGPASTITVPLHLNACYKENGRLHVVTYSGQESITDDHVAAACALNGHYCEGRVAYDGAYAANTQMESLVNDAGIQDILVIAAYPAHGHVSPVHPAFLRATKSDGIKTFVTHEIHREIAYYAGRGERIHVAQPDAIPAADAHLQMDMATQQALWTTGEKEAEKWLARHALNIGCRSTLPYTFEPEKAAPQHVVA